MTGLGMLGDDSPEEAIHREPREMVSVSPELWGLLRSLYVGGAMRAEFLAAWTNGRAFLEADDGLRGRVPRIVEWKGATRSPGDEAVPADLRVDHVYLVSCKYLSRIVLNASPHYLFDRLLAGGQGLRGVDWYRTVAGDELDELCGAACRHVGLPFSGFDRLTSDDRRALALALAKRWPDELRSDARRFASVVASRTAQRWQDALASARTPEQLLWRLLRIGSAPYFVLGTDKAHTLRLRVETPWDWRQRYRLTGFQVGTQASDQPVVTWSAQVEELRSGVNRRVSGHVEVRWSHGKFKSPPEAKVHLDTPHHRVPGYVTI
ncbi:MAG: hypothetical protein ACLGI8_02935 [Acidimicrobiia bacterium]